jgi:signal transduction histidine kinase
MADKGGNSDGRTGRLAPQQVKFEADGASALAERADFSLSEILARMSHEMRTPLSAILGYAQLMEGSAPAPTLAQHKSLDLILQAGWYLEKLIDTTRDLALIQSGAFALSLAPVPLPAIMLDCQAMMESQAQIRGVRVTFPRFETPCFVLADGIRLQQVLGNLLSVAIESSKAGGTVFVDCELRHLDWIRIGINDGGSFAQPANAADGTGVCLLLARRLVELMGGAVCAEGAIGTGRVFSFDLKRVPAPMAVGTSTHSFNASETSAASSITG